MSTSFVGLRSQHNIARIEIPLIQRDYAHGRNDPSTTRIREALLDAMLNALEQPDRRQGLDFVYGDVRDGTLIPLDGQQRLSTLFLLHWYLAARMNFTDLDWAGLPEFRYRTRPSSTEFCERLVTARPFVTPFSAETGQKNGLSTWLRDQSWFRSAWERDPTVTGMLVTLDALHDRVNGRGLDVVSLRAAWSRLVAAQNPPLYFDLLLTKNIGPGDRQYIRMNARGKALTEFERFKASIEQFLHVQAPADGTEFSRQVDGPWTDLLWPLRERGTGRAEDSLIDDEFLRLFRYLAAFSVWQYPVANLGAAPDKDQQLSDWAKGLLGSTAPNAASAQRRFVFDALNALATTFNGNDKAAIDAVFARYFSKDYHQHEHVTIFSNTNLLENCVRQYGDGAAFTLAEQLLLYALLRAWIGKSIPDVEGVRVLRNLLRAPDADLDAKSMSQRFVPGVDKLVGLRFPMVAGRLTATLGSYFRGRQLSEEDEKQQRKIAVPSLVKAIDRLEDHPLLEGCLRAFDLSVTTADLSRRVEQFYLVFPPDEPCRYGSLLTGALLSKGDYSWPWNGYQDRFQFGSSSKKESWRDVLTGPRDDVASLKRLRDALAFLLDDVAALSGSIDGRLQLIIDNWTKKIERKSKFDWRYYLVKYPVMCSGASGIYVSSGTPPTGFDLLMLDKVRLSSYYDDAYITAAVECSDIVKDEVEYFFYGDEHRDQTQRWLRTTSQAKILHADPVGWMVEMLGDPPPPGFLSVVRNLAGRKQRGEPQWRFAVPQTQDRRGNMVDCEDRVELGVKLLRALRPLYV